MNELKRFSEKVTNKEQNNNSNYSDCNLLLTKESHEQLFEGEKVIGFYLIKLNGAFIHQISMVNLDNSKIQVRSIDKISSISHNFILNNNQNSLKITDICIISSNKFNEYLKNINMDMDNYLNILNSIKKRNIFGIENELPENIFLKKITNLEKNNKSNLSDYKVLLTKEMQTRLFNGEESVPCLYISYDSSYLKSKLYLSNNKITARPLFSGISGESFFLTKFGIGSIKKNDFCLISKKRFEEIWSQNMKIY